MRVSGNYNRIQQSVLCNRAMDAGLCIDGFLCEGSWKVSSNGCGSLTKNGNRAASFLKIIEKKMENYLVIPNNLLLSLSLSSQTNKHPLTHICIRAREACRLINKQRAFRSSLCLLFYVRSPTVQVQDKNDITIIFN